MYPGRVATDSWAFFYMAPNSLLYINVNKMKNNICLSAAIN